jgi:N-acetylneuraminic acid mutarotase
MTQTTAFGFMIRCAILAFSTVLIGACTMLPMPDGNIDPRFHIAGAGAETPYPTTIAAMAVDQRTGKVFIGGAFTSIYDTPAANIATTDDVTGRWTSLAESGLKSDSFGTDLVVRSLAVFDKYLYVGGSFSQTQDGTTTNIHNLVRYNIDEKKWEPLENRGVNGPVNALSVFGVDLFVGGFFSFASDGGGPNLHNIFSINPFTGGWFPFHGNGLDGPVYALIGAGDDLFVGGAFSASSDGTTTGLNRIARYNVITREPSALNHSGLNGNVYALLFYNDELYVGGAFSQTADGVVLGLNNLTRYQYPLGIWSEMDSGGVNGEVYALALRGRRLFIGGQFTENSGGRFLPHIAEYRLEDDIWLSLPFDGLDQNVYALGFAHTYGATDDLYAGGRFNTTYNGNISLYGIVGYRMRIVSFRQGKTAVPDSTLFQPGLGSGIALNRDVRALAVDAAGNVITGGYFTQTADGATSNLNGIASFSPATNSWSAFPNNGLDSGVQALARAGDKLYVGGAFSSTNDGAVTNLNRIARFDLTTQTWSPLAGNGLNGFVNGLAVFGDNLYVGGNFTQTADGTTTNLGRIARYNLTTNTWFPVSGNGLNGTVNALVMVGTDLYAGGSFLATFDGTVTGLNRFARYDTLTDTWSPVTDLGLNNEVSALTVSDNFVFVAGSFSRTFDGGTNLNNLARYDTGAESWSPITGNLDVYTAARLTYAAVRSGNDLYVGGSFRQVNSGVARYFTRIYLEQWKVPAGTTDWFDTANWTLDNVPAANTNAVIPAGAGNINITSADVTLNDLMLNGGVLTVGAGRTLTINGILGLRDGIINGAGTVVITSCKPDAIVGGDGAGNVQATLVRCVNDTGIFNFPVGTANGASPVTVKQITGAGNVSIRANQGAYANPVTGLPAFRLGRWWQIDNPGGGVTQADIYFGYLPGDVAGTETSNRAYRITGGLATMMETSVNTFNHRAAVPGISGFSDWTLANNAPTAANVTVGGRVLNAKGQGISQARVELTAQSGVTRTALSNAFGYYHFDDIPPGQVCIISVQHKRYQFANNPQVITVTGALSDVDLVAEP